MGALDQVVKQLILVKADTSQAKQAIKELSGEEKKAAKERLDDIERQNSKLESSVKGWTKVAAGVTGAVVAFKFASKAAQAAMEDAKRAGTAGQGAAKEWQEATAKWKGSVDQLMVSFGKLVLEMAPLIDSMAELVGLIAQAVELMSRPRQAASEFIKLGQAFGTTANAAFSGNRSYSRMALDMGSKLSKPYALGVPDDFFTTGHFEKSRDLMQLYGAGLLAVQDKWGELAARLQPKKAGKSQGLSSLTKAGLDPLLAFPDLFAAFRGAAGDVGGALSGTYADARKGVTLGEEDQTGLERLRALLEQAKRDVAEWQNEVAQMQRDRQQSFLESIFGPVDQFNTYAAGFQLLQGAATDAFDAWITGSMSMGQAIKRSIAEGLRGVASQMLIESLKHAAFALGSLAFLDFGGAGRHAAAAAAFGAGALTAGVAARALGAGGVQQYSGGAGSAGAGAGGYLTSGSAGSLGKGTADQTTIIYLAPDWSDETPTQRKQKLERAVREGAVARTRNLVIHG